MPVLRGDEIETMIGDGSIAGMAIDTSIFDRYRCDLDHPRLQRLDQLAESKLQLYLPEIVVRELRNHIARLAAESQAAVRKAFSDHNRRWQLELDTAALQLEADPIAEADRQVTRFLRRTGGKEIPLAGAEDLTAQAVERYFRSAPPFEVREQKKHEFPDAFALLSLEALAGRRKRIILCVSADKGWERFCAESEDLAWVADLDSALSFLNASGRTRAEEVARRLREAGVGTLERQAVRGAFRHRLRELDFIAEARSSLDYTATPIREDLNKIEFATTSHPLVIEATKEEVTFTLKVKARVIFTARFDFHAGGGGDHELVELASVERDTDKVLAYDVIMTVTREDKGLGSILHVVVDRPLARVRFGTIEPFES